MAEKTLVELQELAKPALPHAELVNLARVESPNKAYEMASVRWPRRQAKATRFLAMLRRDYGQGAFEALLMEHARPNGSEHAQGDKSMVKLNDLYPADVRDVVFGPGAHQAQMLKIQFVGKDQEVGLKDEITRLGLSPDEEKILVRRVLDAMLTQWASPKVRQFYYGIMWQSALVAARHYFPDDRELYKQLLRATVIYNGGYDKHTRSLAGAVVPEKLHALCKADHGRPPSSQTSLQLVIDHMLEMGISAEEVRTIWGEMIKIRFQQKFLSVCIHDWWYGLLVEGKDLNQVVEKVNRQCVMQELGILTDSRKRGWIYYDADEFLATVTQMCNATDYHWRQTEEAREAVEEMLIDCLARGEAGRAYFVLTRFGGHFRFFQDHSGIDVKEIGQALSRLMRGALERAAELRNFGIASALAEHLGDVERADELRAKARHLSQPVALDFAYEYHLDISGQFGRR